MHTKANHELAAQALAVLAGLLLVGVAHAGRALVPQDWYRFQVLSELQMAPDGTAVAYLVTHYDKDLDESRTELWRTDWSGGESVQLTRGESVSDPRFSPDGRKVAIDSPHGGEGWQLYLIDISALLKT